MLEAQIVGFKVEYLKESADDEQFLGYSTTHTKSIEVMTTAKKKFGYHTHCLPTNIRPRMLEFTLRL